MEDENEDKKVDTQTTGNDAKGSKGNQDAKVDAVFGNTESNQDNDGSNNAENNSDASNQNKNEDEKVRKNKNVAKKNEDGSITFKNQEELDGFIARKYAQGAQKATQGATTKQKQNASNTQQDADEDTNDNNSENNQNGGEKSALPTDYFADKIGLAMAVKGVKPEKLKRASRMIEQEKVIVNGILDTTKLDEEIDAVISEFPELLKAENSADQKGFKFGSEGSQAQDSNNINDEIDSIFGNK